MNSFARILGLSSVTALLFACAGDDVTNIYEPGMDVIAEGEDLPECDVDLQGKLVFSTDSGRAFFCNEGEWNIFVGEADKGDKGDAGQSCTARSIDEGVEITCGEDVIDTLVNGKDAKDGKSCSARTIKEGIEVTCGKDVVDTLVNGKNGKNGKDGKSCSARTIKEGVEVSCDSVVVDTLVNGENGKDGEGKEGAPGKGCTARSIAEGVEITCGESDIDTVFNASSSVSVEGGCVVDSDEGGVVVLDCDGVKSTIFKAECEGVPYDPAANFCLAGKVSPLSGKCGEDDIDLTKQFCDERDNQVYNYIVVQYNGHQKIWMAQDLNFETDDGSVSIEGMGADSRLYTWNSAIQLTSGTATIDHDFYQGVCPDGWHLPTYDDIYDLANFDGKLQESGSNPTNNGGAGVLKSSEDGSWPRVQIGQNAFTGPGSNDLGFSALPKGYYDAGQDELIESFFVLWSSTSVNDNNTMVLQMDANSNQIRIVPFMYLNKASVRCVMNY